MSTIMGATRMRLRLNTYFIAQYTARGTGRSDAGSNRSYNWGFRLIFLVFSPDIDPFCVRVEPNDCFNA